MALGRQKFFDPFVAMPDGEAFGQAGVVSRCREQVTVVEDEPAIVASRELGCECESSEHNLV